MKKKKQKRDIDVLEQMRKRGDIGSAEFEAGRLFQQQFADAHCGGTGSIDYEKNGGGNSVSSPTEAAVMRGPSVFRALERVGGMRSPCGKAAWEVLGEGRSMSEWASKAGYERAEAKGIVLACLSILARHYGFA